MTVAVPWPAGAEIASEVAVPPVIVSGIALFVLFAATVAEDGWGVGTAAIMIVTARVESFGARSDAAIEKLSVPTASAAGVYVIWLSGFEYRYYPCQRACSSSCPTRLSRSS
jgi:hypothetical protein